MTKTRRPQDAVVANVKRLRVELRAHARQANRRLRQLEADIRFINRLISGWGKVRS